MAILGIPITALASINAAALLLLLPFVYLIGMLFDSTIHFPLEPFRKRIRNSVLQYEKYKDEVMAHLSPVLYSAYEVRVRRVRIMGAAIFNWPLFGIALLFHSGFSYPVFYISIITFSAIMCILSIVAWRGLYRRAYKFRKNAIDTIRESSKEKPSAKTKSET